MASHISRLPSVGKGLAQTFCEPVVKLLAPRIKLRSSTGIISLGAGSQRVRGQAHEALGGLDPFGIQSTVPLTKRHFKSTGFLLCSVRWYTIPLGAEVEDTAQEVRRLPANRQSSSRRVAPRSRTVAREPSYCTVTLVQRCHTNGRNGWRFGTGLCASWTRQPGLVIYERTRPSSSLLPSCQRVSDRRCTAFKRPHVWCSSSALTVLKVRSTACYRKQTQSNRNGLLPMAWGGIPRRWDLGLSIVSKKLFKAKASLEWTSHISV